jgi:hypothetical protein
MNSDEAHKPPVPVKDEAAARGRPSVRRIVFGAVGLVAALLSAVFLVPSPMVLSMQGYLCGLRLLYIFAATFFLCISFLRSRGPGVAAEHGAAGLLAGYLIGCIHLWPAKEGGEAFSMAAFVLGSIAGAAFGIVFGMMRSSLAEPVTENASVNEREQDGKKENERQAAGYPPE